jgi:hypothetical protein
MTDIDLNATREDLARVIEAGWGNPIWDGETLRQIDRQIAEAVLAAGYMPPAEVARLTEQRDQYAAVIVSVHDYLWDDSVDYTDEAHIQSLIDAVPAATLAVRDAEKEAEGLTEAVQHFKAGAKDGTQTVAESTAVELLRQYMAQQGEPQ